MKRAMRCDLCGSGAEVSLYAFRHLCGACRRGSFWGVSLRKPADRGGRRERRREARTESYLLVACEPLPRPADSRPIEMWASHISRRGLRLTWTLPWVCNSCSYRLWWKPGYECRIETCPFIPKDAWLRTGRRITIHNLAYSGRESSPVRATIVWTRSDDGHRREIGARFVLKGRKIVGEALIAAPSSRENGRH